MMIRTIPVLVSMLVASATAEEPMPLCMEPNPTSNEVPAWCPAPDGTIPEPVSCDGERDCFAQERLDARPLPGHCPYLAKPGTKGHFIAEEITPEIGGAFGRFVPDPNGESTYCVTSVPAADLQLTYDCLKRFGATATPAGITVKSENASLAGWVRSGWLDLKASSVDVPVIGGLFDWSALCGTIAVLGTRYGFTPLEFINEFKDTMDDCQGGDAEACTVICPPCGSDWVCLGDIQASSGEFLTVEGARDAVFSGPPTSVGASDRLRAKDENGKPSNPSLALGAVTCLARADAVASQVSALPIAAQLACTTDRPNPAFCDHWAFGWALYEFAFQGDRLPEWLAQPVEAGGKLLKGAGYAATVYDHIGWETTTTTTRIFEYGQLVSGPIETVTDTPYLIREFDLPQGEFSVALQDIQHRLLWLGRLKDLLQTTLALQRFDAAARAFDAAGYPTCAAKARDVIEGVIAFYAQPMWQTAQGIAQKSLLETLLVGSTLVAPAVGFVWLGVDLLDASVIAVRSELAANIQRVLRGTIVEDVATWPTDRCGDIPLACADVERDATLLQMSTYADFAIGRWMSSIYDKWLLKGVATTTDALGTVRVELEKNDYLRGLAQWLLGGFDEHADDSYEQHRAEFEAMEEVGRTALDGMPPPIYLPAAVTDHLAAAVQSGYTP
ncbi:hypothetical protein HY635_04205 [Candidatus Uhrbacteria bacterium]|nr:hypothetical protein [Candidatus Uhrbacteria bacterium]